MRPCQQIPQQLLLSLVLVAAAFTGCVSRGQAKAEARAAFLAGQQEAMLRFQQQNTAPPNRNPTVTIMGHVKNPILPWTEELTLARALLSAEFLSRRDPRQILITRNGQQIHVDPERLVNGEDVPLQPGDVVQIGE
jgi:protein involved in polysaccharide export with SLBB domain